MGNIDNVFHDVIGTIDAANSLAAVPDILEAIRGQYILQKVAYVAWMTSSYAGKSRYRPAEPKPRQCT
ncbi:hypothetical protein [Phyllobacterium meliloti]|uniref:hypothetical protein n=1 Tax=Phyllobacterium meliloti TaxID=555317 RepID=UPI001D13B924|nr:hypothetical protein [Phyllobacterium sp. T1293]UGX88463.1 hypothetical protein LLE53_018715 [Phyllobacterium sp. T1293]